MNERQFWDIIGRTCQGRWLILPLAGEDEEGWDEFRWHSRLLAEVKKLPPENIVLFQRWFDEKTHAIYTWDHWGAMRLITASESDGAFYRFQCWLVGMGEKVYEAALHNPDSLADVIDPLCQDEYMTDIGGVGYHAWQDLGLEMDDFDKVYTALGKRQRPEITGEEWPSTIPPKMLEKRYPRLARLFGLR